MAYGSDFEEGSRLQPLKVALNGQVKELKALYAEGEAPTQGYKLFSFFIRVAPPATDSEVYDARSGELVFKGPLAHAVAWVAAKNSLGARTELQRLEDWKTHQGKVACELLLTIVEMGVKSIGDTLVSKGAFDTRDAEEVLLTALVRKYSATEGALP